jgi:hypothetical protein
VEGLCERGDERPGSIKMLGSSRAAAQLAASQEGRSSMRCHCLFRTPYLPLYRHAARTIN